MKIPFKNAAKKALKDIKENIEDIANLSHTQFLDKFAIWHGYTSYYQVVSQTKLNTPVVDESGLITKILKSNQKLLISAKPGSGCGYLRKLLIANALNKNINVRVIDCARLYTDYLEKIKCDFNEVNQWFSNKRICIYDLEEQGDDFLKTIFENPQKNVLYIIDDLWKIVSKIEDKQFSAWLEKIDFCCVAETPGDLERHSLTNQLFNSKIVPMEVHKQKHVNWLYSFKNKDIHLGGECISSIGLRTTCEGIFLRSD